MTIPLEEGRLPVPGFRLDRLRAFGSCLAILLTLAATAAAPQARSKAAPGASAKPRKTPVKKPVEGAAIEGGAALAPFFERLRDFAAEKNDPAAVPLVRVAVFGDSHTAAGYWTGRLRSRFQARFGDGGPGVLLPARPWRGYSREDLEQEFNRRWPAQCLRTAEASGRVGLAGAALEIPPDERLVLRGSFGGFRLHLLGPAGTEPVVAPPDVEPVEAAPTALLLREVLRSPLDDRLALRILEPDSTGPFPALSIGLPEGLRLLGVDLRSGRPGAVVDELGLNGAELFDLERWDPTLSAVLLAELRPSLLVLAFGTNDLGRRDLDGAAYRVHAARLLRSLKEAGGAPILLVGPLDRMGRRRRGQNLKLGAKTVIEAMRGASADAGCAFWNARAAMGGEGSIQRWRKQRLAQRDLVHLSVGGYQKLADLLMKAMDEAEAAWKKRQAEPE